MPSLIIRNGGNKMNLENMFMKKARYLGETNEKLGLTHGRVYPADIWPNSPTATIIRNDNGIPMAVYRGEWERA